MFEFCATVLWQGKGCKELAGSSYAGVFVCVVSPLGHPTKVVGAFEWTWMADGREYKFIERVVGVRPGRARATASIDLRAINVTCDTEDP